MTKTHAKIFGGFVMVIMLCFAFIPARTSAVGSVLRPALGNVTNASVGAERVVVTTDGGLSVFSSDGKLLPGFPVFADDIILTHSPVLADVNGDGLQEIVSFGRESGNDEGLIIFDGNGVLLGTSFFLGSGYTVGEPVVMHPRTGLKDDVVVSFQSGEIFGYHFEDVSSISKYPLATLQAPAHITASLSGNRLYAVGTDQDIFSIFGRNTSGVWSLILEKQLEWIPLYPLLDNGAGVLYGVDGIGTVRGIFALNGVKEVNVFYTLPLLPVREPILGDIDASNPGDELIFDLTDGRVAVLSQDGRGLQVIQKKKSFLNSSASMYDWGNGLYSFQQTSRTNVLLSPTKTTVRGVFAKTTLPDVAVPVVTSTAPDAVTNITVASDESHVRITWGVYDDPYGDIDHFNIYRATSTIDTVESLTAIASVPFVSSPLYDDTDIVYDTTYYYAVTAVRNDGLESVSDAWFGPSVVATPTFSVIELSLEGTFNILLNQVITDLNGRVDVDNDFDFVITNRGTGDLVLGNTPIELSGNDASIFSVIQEPSQTIAPGATATFTLRVVTSTVGIYHATLSIFSNDEATSEFSFGMVVNLTDVPGSPESLVNEIVGRNVHVSWTAPADDGGKAIVDYRIEQKRTDESEFTLIDDGISQTPSVVLSNLEYETRYDVRVFAKNENGLSVLAGETTITMPDAPLTLFDGSEGIVAPWSVSDRTPSGFVLDVVYEDDLYGNVIQFTGTGRDNAFLLRNADKTKWNNTTHKVAMWDMKFESAYVIYLVLTTDQGPRVLRYAPSGYVGGRNDNYYGWLNLGEDTIDGTWHHIVRDITADLRTVYPALTLQSIDLMEVRGTGKMDNIGLALGASIGSITGTVETQDGTPIVGASVLLLPNNMVMLTDMNGFYSFGSLPYGEYSLQTVARGYTVETDIMVSLETSNVNQTIIATIIPNIVLFDGDQGDTEWIVYDNTPEGATVEIVFEDEWYGNVVEFTSNGIKNAFLSKGSVRGGWDVREHRYLEWDMNIQGDYVLYIGLTTDQGVRYIKYTRNGAIGLASDGKTVQLRLPVSANSGSWYHVARNLSADLQSVLPNESLLSINFMEVLGSGKIDNITARVSSDIGTIQTTVHDELGNPLSGARVTLNPLGLSGKTKADGTYDFVGVQYGAYTLSADYMGYAFSIADQQVLLEENVTSTMFAGTVLSTVVLFDGDLATTQWYVYDNDPIGAEANVVYEDAVYGNVISLTSDGTKNAFLLRKPLNKNWDITAQKFMEWDMNMSGQFVYFVAITTDEGVKYLRYSPYGSSKGVPDTRYIPLYLDANVNDGTWHHVSRSLLDDLHSQFPELSIVSVDFFEVLGSGKIDNVQVNARGDFGDIAGIVTDETGKSISGSTVTLLPSGLVAKTNADGQYQFQNRPFGTYAISIQKNGYIFPASADIILSGESVVYDIVGNHVETLVLFDGDVATTQWYVYDNDPVGAEANIVYEDVVYGNVVSFSSADTKNAFLLRKPVNKNWNIDTHKYISWDMNYPGNFVIFMGVTTNDGIRYLKYVPAGKSTNSSDSRYITFNLPSSANNGNWHHEVRDLEYDLKTINPELQIITVDFMETLGRGKMDNVEMVYTRPDGELDPTFIVEKDVSVLDGVVLSGTQGAVIGQYTMTLTNPEKVLPEFWLGDIFFDISFDPYVASPISSVEVVVNGKVRGELRHEGWSSLSGYESPMRQLWFMDTEEIPKDQTTVIKLVANFENVITDGTIQTSIVGYNAGPNEYSFSRSGINIQGQEMAIQVPVGSLSVIADPAFQGGFVIEPANDVTISQFTLSADDIEDIIVHGLTIQIPGSDVAGAPYENLTLWNGDTLLGTGVQDGDLWTFAFTSTIQQGSSAMWSLHTDIITLPPMEINVQPVITGLSADTLSTMRRIDTSSLHVEGQRLILYGGARLQVEQDSASVVSRILYPGQIGQSFGKFRISEVSGAEDVAVEALRFVVVDGDNQAVVDEQNFDTVSLYDSSGLPLSQGQVVEGAVSFLGLQKIIPASGSTIVELRANIAVEGIMNPAVVRGFAIADDESGVDAYGVSSTITLSPNAINNPGIETVIAPSPVFLFHIETPVITQMVRGPFSFLAVARHAEIHRFSITNSGTLPMRIGKVDVALTIQGMGDQGNISTFTLESNGVILARNNAILSGPFVLQDVRFDETHGIDGSFDHVLINPGQTQVFSVYADTSHIKDGVVAGMSSFSATIPGTVGYSAGDVVDEHDWANGGIGYFYTPFGGVENTVSYSASASYPILPEVSIF